MISHHDKCVFVHVPKCAGQSIEVFFLERIGLDWKRRAPLLLRPNDVAELGPPRLAHLKAYEYVEKRWVTPSQFSEYFKFTFVRNPWDRIASFYRYLGYDTRCSLPRFVSKHLPRRLDDMHWFIGPALEYLYDRDGQLMVDFVGRFENLAQDFATVCERMGIGNPTLPHINNSAVAPNMLQLLRRHRGQRYRQMYDTRSRDLIERVYERDIAAFGYQF